MSNSTTESGWSFLKIKASFMMGLIDIRGLSGFHAQHKNIDISIIINCITLKHSSKTHKTDDNPAQLDTAVCAHLR